LVVFGGFRLARTGRVADATRAAAALVVAAAAFAVAHLAWYGGLTPYASGDHFVDGQLTVVGSDPDYVGRATRLVGLLVDRDFGLAAWHPLYLLAVPALVFLVRRRPPGWSVLTLVLAAGWCNASFVALTMHGWWFPGRQVVVVLPALVLALAWFVAQVPRLLPVVVALGGLGASVFAWFVVEAAVSDLTIVVDFESMTHPVVGAWRALLPDYRRGALVDWSLHAAWLAAITVTIRGVWRGGAPSTPDPSRPTAPSDLSLELHRSPSS
ncbi:MAG TPA: hypothetical protein VFZ83_11535, partial [Acidimicrobiia bacterium]|nr:hypothetical protein [Acidimicrobiia bacterium]